LSALVSAIDRYSIIINTTTDVTMEMTAKMEPSVNQNKVNLGL